MYCRSAILRDLFRHVSAVFADVMLGKTVATLSICLALPRVTVENNKCVMCRNGRGQGALRDLLNPLVRSILDDRNILINTHPTEVYKQWINQMEAETGKTR